MSKANNLTDFLTGVANAIRAKKGTTGTINPQNFESEIASISGGGDIENFSGTLSITGDNQGWMYYFFGFDGGLVYREHGYYQIGSQVQFEDSCILILAALQGSGFYMVSPDDAELIGPDSDNNVQLFKIIGSSVTIYENED